MPLFTPHGLLSYQNGGRKRPLYSYTPNFLCFSPSIILTYVPMRMDDETAEWMRGASNIAPLKLFLANFLRMFLSRTTANGIVSRGEMFVMSTAQAVHLLTGRPAEKLPLTTPLFGTLLDIGAGDGGVTSRLRPLFRHVMTTECSFSMRWRLWWRGYEVLPHHSPFVHADGSRRYYDVIACLNVLDRVDKPLQLLREIRDSLAPNGILLLAVVLPWCPFVEDGTRQRIPSEKLPMEGGECCRGASYEDSLQRLVDNVLIPSGFKLERWSKLPYFCEGDFQLEYAVLHDAVFVLKRDQEDLSLVEKRGEEEAT